MNQAHYHPTTEAGVVGQRGSEVPTVTELASAGGAGIRNADKIPVHTEIQFLPGILYSSL